MAKSAAADAAKLEQYKKETGQLKTQVQRLQSSLVQAEKEISTKEKEHRDEISAIGRALDSTQKTLEEERKKHAEALGTVRRDLTEQVSTTDLTF